MKESTRQNLVASDIWARLLYMILFAIAYSLAKMLIIAICVYQFFAVLITGSANEPLLRFGKNLAIYMLEILEFQTFNSELRPFPFTPWPDEEPGGGIWLEEMNEDDDNGADDQTVAGTSEPETERAAPRQEASAADEPAAAAESESESDNRKPDTPA
ncbi:MAG: DUF4389 domain-containing protein [Pseudomonadales bacterium]|nr:DUF4389 domain-containing protein [Pseudomonadales bacterium]